MRSTLSMKTLTATQRRQARLLIVLVVLSLFELKAFGVGNNAHAKTTFGFTLGKEWIIIEKWMIDSRTGCFIFSTIAILGSLLGLARVRVKKGPGLGIGIASFSLMMGFLCWAAAGKFIPFTGMLQGSLLLAVPLVFGSMSGLLCERSGVKPHS